MDASLLVDVMAQTIGADNGGAFFSGRNLSFFNVVRKTMKNMLLLFLLLFCHMMAQEENRIYVDVSDVFTAENHQWIVIQDGIGLLLHDIHFEAGAYYFFPSDVIKHIQTIGSIEKAYLREGRKYYCRECNLSFSHDYQLWRHVEYTHNGDRPPRRGRRGESRTFTENDLKKYTQSKQ